jgi:gamma-glutamyltranspeptidase
MVLEDGKPQTVIATMGGSGQTQILTEVLLRLRLGDDPLAAVSAPRWVLGGFGGSDSAGQILVEERLPAVARESLDRLSMPIRTLPDFDDNVGHTQLIVVAPDGASFDAASDPRSEGAAIVAHR